MATKTVPAKKAAAKQVAVKKAASGKAPAPQRASRKTSTTSNDGDGRGGMPIVRESPKP
jgi:hypothetical protein